jgi:thiamine biosynthesis lipoprotein
MGTTIMLTPPDSTDLGAPARHRHEVHVAALGGTVRLILVGGGGPTSPTPDDLAGFAALGAARLADLEARWSRFRPDSEISRLNTSGGAVHLLSPATYALVERGVAAWRMTDGRCDATVLSSMARLGSVPTGDTRPLPVRPSPGCGAVTLVPEIGAVRLAPGVGLDLGAVGRGFAADLVAAELIAAGAPGVLVDVDGDARACGLGPDDGAWEVRVADPHRPGHALARLALTDGAAATSTPRRPVGDGAAAPRPVVDPRTGRPVGDGLASVTVLAGDAWVAEALSTAALVEGRAGAAAFLAERHATALLVAADGTVEHVGPLAHHLA